MRRYYSLLLQIFTLLFVLSLCNTEGYCKVDFVELEHSLELIPKKDTTKKVEFGSEAVDIERVEVRANRRRYNRDSPAVKLAKRLIASRDSLNPAMVHNYLEYEKYEKIVISINDYKDMDSTSGLSFLNDHKMINPQTGKTILPVSLREEIVLHQHSKKPFLNSQKRLYFKSSGVDDRFSESTVLAFLNEALPQIELFDDYVYLVQRQFVSPLAKNSFNFYRFTLSPDTVDYKGARCVELNFFPFSKNSLALRGCLIVEIDSTGVNTPFIRYADVSIPHTSDVNYLSNIYIEQSFRRDSLGLREIEWESSSFDASPVKSTPAINIRRTNNFYGYSTVEDLESQEIVASAFKEPQGVVQNEGSERNDVYQEQKIENFKPTKQEREVLKIAKQLRRKLLYLIAEEALLIATEGYFQTGKKSYFDIGPVAQFISGSTLEGTKLSFGGITTPNLSRHIFFDGMVGYGFGDHQWKYDLSVEYSFIPKENFYKEFPVNSLRATYSYNVFNFGSEFDDLNKESLFSWAKRSGEQKQTYMRLAQLRYKREWENNFSMNLYARNYTNYETPLMTFGQTFGELPSYTMSEAELRLRYAPGETIYQTRRRRRQLSKYIPIFELSHTAGFKDVLGGEYTRNLTKLRGYGRVNLQPFGYLNLDVTAAAEWSSVPYMLLPYPRTNQTYIVSELTHFSVMNPMEFIYDKYIYL